MNGKLAEIARAEARKNYYGTTEAAIGNLQALEALFSDVDGVTYEMLNTDWSGAFVYLCTKLAGMSLPVRYPDPRVHASFASAISWVEYARLPKIRLWRKNSTTPEVGDIAVLAPTEHTPCLLGVVLAVLEDRAELAIGNYHNHSAIVEKPLCEIYGYIRLT